ncbi:hypothetical protein JSR06_00725 [Candidatus Vidania fulgoroideae]|uniref:50S ribosomal protein L6 n=1 Tax=Candidatus Vidania fulgoroideorum TaxID=881286 RepID=A0A974X7G9_9PROT|nr:hypothetical protein JSR06_00725 [Candidatus Vidania fulgoroideae]
MSKKGRKPITISNIFITYKLRVITIKGRYGELSFRLKGLFFIFLVRNNIFIRPCYKKYNNLWGTYFSCISNILFGTNFMFKDTLIIDGVGYSFDLDKKSLLVDIGFSKVVNITIPSELYCKLSNNKDKLHIRSINNIALGDFCHVIKNLRRYNPYKKIGIRSINEIKVLKSRNKK